MASVANLLMLLAIAVPIIQSISNHSEEDTFPHGNPTQETPAQTEDPDYQLCMMENSVPEISQACCPPFGSPDDQFNVTVMGNLSSTIFGCAYMKKFHPEEHAGFNLWLTDFDIGVGNCNDKELGDLNHENITHAIFHCLFKKRFIDEEKNINGWYVTLMEPFKKWSDRSILYCALYSIINEDPPMIQMVISANNSCDDLAATMANVEQKNVPEGLRNFEDGSIALLFSKNFP